MVVRQEIRRFTFGQYCFSYTLVRKAVKNINLHISLDGIISVSANTAVKGETIDELLQSKGTYIVKSLRRLQNRQKLPLPVLQYVSGEQLYLLGEKLSVQVVEGRPEEVFCDRTHVYFKVRAGESFRSKELLWSQYVRRQCMAIFGEILAKLYPLIATYGVELPLFRVRTMKSRWGSCMPRKSMITLNTSLLKAPLGCIELVIMHELCHFVYPNHSRQFYNFLTMLMPDWKERKILLEQPR